MAKTQFTQKRHSLSPRRILGALVALAVAFLLMTSVINVAQKYVATKKHIHDLALEEQTLREKQDALIKTNAYLATPEGMEQALRKKYNVVKPGEGIIVINNAASPASPESHSIVGRWWKAILAGLGIHKD